MNKNVNAKL